MTIDRVFAARCYERQETLVPPSITAAGGAGFMSVSKISPGVMIGQTLEFTVKVHPVLQRPDCPRGR